MRCSRTFWLLVTSHLAVAALAVGLLEWSPRRWQGGGPQPALAALLASGLAAALVAWGLTGRWLRPLHHLTTTLQAMAGGWYAQRVPAPAAADLRPLAEAANALAAHCDARFSALVRGQRELEAAFRGMVEGVVVIDAGQHVRLLNEAAQRLWNLTPERSLGRPLWELFRHRALARAVEQALASLEPVRCELEWPAPPRILALHLARLPGEPLQGAVLVFHDVTHLRHLERLRQDFSANVSHELKTPLAAIQATAETLLDGAWCDPDHNVRFLQRILENAERLHHLVQDLLTLSGLESGQEVLEIGPVAVGPVVAACVARQEPRALAKALALVQEPPAGEEPLALADEEALTTMLDNLVDNALKYTPSGGRVTLRWQAEGETVVVAVADTGVGIPEKDLPRIFERFYRVDKARSRALGGTGLGLAIVKHLAQALGGAVTAESQLGRGSTFTLRLPRAPAPRPGPARPTPAAPAPAPPPGPASDRAGSGPR